MSSEPTRIDPPPMTSYKCPKQPYGPIWDCFRDKRRFQSKITNFVPSRVYLTSPLKGFPLELGSGAGVKNWNDGLLGRERSLTLSSAVWIQYLNMTNRRTGRRTSYRHRATAKTALTHSVACMVKAIEALLFLMEHN